MGNVLNYFLNRMVEYPVKRRPMCFYEANEFDATGNPYPTVARGEVVYDRVMKELFADVLEWRRHLQAAREKHSKCKPEELVLRYPEWDVVIIHDLLNTFTALDINNDGIVHFKEVSMIMNDFGDVSSPETRRAEFDAVDTNKRGYLDFEQFTDFMYSVTVKGNNPGNLGHTLLIVDQNVKAVNSMSVLQQIDAGLF